MLKYQVRAGNRINRRAFSPAPSSTSTASTSSAFSSSSTATDNPITTENEVVTVYSMKPSMVSFSSSTECVNDSKLNYSTLDDKAFHCTLISILEKNDIHYNTNSISSTINVQQIPAETENMAPPIPRKPQRHMLPKYAMAHSTTTSPLTERRNFSYELSPNMHDLVPSPLIERRKLSAPPPIAKKPSLVLKQNIIAAKAIKNLPSPIINCINDEISTKLEKCSINDHLDPISIQELNPRTLLPNIRNLVNTRLLNNNIINTDNRSNSLSSLSSLDSGESSSDWGYLRIFTRSIKSDTDYITLKVTGQTTTATVIEKISQKFHLSFCDLNLLQLWMEVRTKMYNGKEVKSVLELKRDAYPLELQRCHPQNMSKFILTNI